MGGMRWRFIVALISCLWHAWCKHCTAYRTQNNRSLRENVNVKNVTIKWDGANFLLSHWKQLSRRARLKVKVQMFEGGIMTPSADAPFHPRAKHTQSLSELRHGCNKSFECHTMTSAVGLLPSTGLHIESSWGCNSHRSQELITKNLFLLWWSSNYFNKYT